MAKGKPPRGRPPRQPTGRGTDRQKGPPKGSDRLDSPATIEKYLKGADYPKTKAELINIARKNKAPEDMIKLMQRMPDRRYSGPDDVIRGTEKAR